MKIRLKNKTKHNPLLRIFFSHLWKNKAGMCFHSSAIGAQETLQFKLTPWSCYPRLHTQWGAFPPSSPTGTKMPKQILGVHQNDTNNELHTQLKVKQNPLNRQEVCTAIPICVHQETGSVRVNCYVPGCTFSQHRALQSVALARS